MKKNPAPIRHAATGISGLRVGSLAEIGRMFGVIGASEIAGRIALAVDRHRELGVTANTAEDTVKAARADLARKIASGDLDPTKAATELVKVEAKANLSGPARELTADARRAVIVGEINTLRTDGDRLVLEVIDPAIQAASDRLLVAADLLPDDPSPEAAIGAGTADAWRTASEAVHVIETGWRLAGRLRSGGITFTLRPPGVPAICWEWINPPALKPTTIGGWATAIGEGRQPTARTAEELLEDMFGRDPDPIPASAGAVVV